MNEIFDEYGTAVVFVVLCAGLAGILWKVLSVISIGG